MSFQEVQSSFFEFEDKRHKILQKTQEYFLKNNFRPYIWFDENHRLRIKHKYRRDIKYFVLDETNEERVKYFKVVEEFAKNNNLKIRFVLDFCETDKMLPKDVQSQWSTEFILEV